MSIHFIRVLLLLHFHSPSFFVVSPNILNQLALELARLAMTLQIFLTHRKI